MLRISKLTDYGVTLATQLASSWEADGTLRVVSELAEVTGIPAPTVAKVLKTLVRADVVVSVRGARGGYRLAAPPAEINVAQIVSALEGPIAITDCTDASVDAPCARDARCGLRPNWSRINAVLLEALRGVSLAEMMRGSAAARDSRESGCGGGAREEEGLVTLGARREPLAVPLTREPVTPAPSTATPAHSREEL